MKLSSLLPSSGLLGPFPELISLSTLSYGYCSTVATCHQPLILGQPLRLTSVFLLIIPKYVSPAQTSPMNSQAPPSGRLVNIST